MKLQMMYSFMKADIDLIEKELHKAITSDSDLIQKASLNLIEAGGKRLRPIFVLLSAKFGKYDIQAIKNVAVALELIHMASLVHDDVIDDAELRRGKLTVKAKWDNRIAMYTGDYILACSLEYMTKIENVEAHRILANTITEVCLGEIEQIKDKYRFNQNLRDYLRRIKRKTALLIAASCQLGAIVSGASEDIHKKLYQFGYYVGMSYQITDDILDFTGTEKVLGKPAGDDLLQGNITLPVLYAMNNMNARTKILTVHENLNKEEMKEIISVIKETGAIEKAHKISQRYLQKALSVIKDLPENRTKKSLIDIANFVGKRKF
ncbi:heptaprenyl diphosphate synthase [Heyndrickxia shackletonii]|uniref:Heptaprenyl diphosphate synthase component 2 n=1 Tax=Heyndrickxia shackletonii TaxID=157838 RepID=A0A0Q3WXJ9_9BACI|nr:heptaprenyl diphosphate synthase component II [Heyndrickxia shackletonii]KQL53703.1 heptaprenyl diphosphate synthase [Heyndrickxia shackletonii]MBB2481658.1 heptaprenyl diphosphate synthase component II [Bacillus sp. APMAM]NEY99842.1 heptaprenyl diphosphate synthase component II [Heyndrickxia shackletonii]RTZ54950.1 heptaprenyl diphosphate synthase component II [Bacillus sp. SAJ1]